MAKTPQRLRVLDYIKHNDAFGGGCWYECEVCGTRTNEVSMPWIAAEQWNNDEVILGNFSLF